MGLLIVWWFLDAKELCVFKVFIGFAMWLLGWLVKLYSVTQCFLGWGAGLFVVLEDDRCWRVVAEHVLTCLESLEVKVTLVAYCCLFWVVDVVLQNYARAFLHSTTP